MVETHTVSAEAMKDEAVVVSSAGVAPSNHGALVPQAKPTKGTKIFNLFTYGGVALVGNELTSLKIMNSAENGWLSKSYSNFNRYFKETLPAKNPNMPKYVSEGRLPMILYALIGGMLMVPPVKWLEDRKGKIVKKIDHMFHGDAMDKDPDMIAAHEKLDNAPKQSWGSLGMGRIVTVFSAIAADATFGWKHSFLANALKDTKAAKFSSLDHIAEQVAIAYTGENKGRMLLESAEKSPKFKNAENLTWLLTLSASLTLLFYGSSKLLAHKRDEKQEKKSSKTLPLQHIPKASADNIETSAITSVDSPTTDKPSAHVSDVMAREILKPVEQQQYV